MRKLITILLIFSTLLGYSQKYVKVTELSAANTDDNEMAPVIYGNGLVFSSNKKSSIIKVSTDSANVYPYKLYYIEKEGRKWVSPRPFAPEIAGNLNEFSACFTSDGKIMYLTRNFGSEETLGELQKENLSKNRGIFQATNTGKKWIISREFAYNNEDYNVAYPSVSPDGKKFYFCSRMPGGFGGYDIYESELSNGRWSSPKNLGATINTKENEIFPFIHENGRLYFSSRAHNSIGRYDVFFSENTNSQWTTPVNLPKPINSNRDDFGYVLSPAMDTGYFVSNRRGTDDIWIVTSDFPQFKECPQQINETFCYRFKETGSLDLDTTSLKYEWDFGDGLKQRGVDAFHCFREPGIYAVALNVIDTLTNEVYFSEATYDLEIKRIEQPYILAPDTVLVNEKTTLDGSMSVVRKFQPKEYFWDFGDGNVEMGTTTQHAYARSGTYFIRIGITTGNDDPMANEIDFSQRACSSKQIVVIKESTK